MVSLIILASSGKGTWKTINSIIEKGNWDKVFLICNEFAYSNFNIDKNKVIKIKFNDKKIIENFNKLSIVLKKQIKDFEIAVNIDSGTGYEHMALISSILKSGLGLRFIYLEQDEIKEFKINNEEYEFETNEENNDYFY